jgi:hypothetical protein
VARKNVVSVDLELLPLSFSKQVAKSVLYRFHQLLKVNIAFAVLLGTHSYKFLNLLLHQRISLGESVRENLKENAEILPAMELFTTEWLDLFG